jgi:hypothetical protein
MDLSTVYVLDSDIFMTPAASYYAFDLVPRFWDVLVEEARHERIRSIDRVKDEIEKVGDKLTDWAKNHFQPFFFSTQSQAVQGQYEAIIRWAHKQQQFLEAAKREFAKNGNADAWLVAYAKVNGCTVVTFEKYEAGAKRRIKIPNVCKAFGVACVDLFGMLRALGVKLS